MRYEIKMKLYYGGEFFRAVETKTYGDDKETAIFKAAHKVKTSGGDIGLHWEDVDFRVKKCKLIQPKNRKRRKN
jgi:hypothetical protein